MRVNLFLLLCSALLSGFLQAQDTNSIMEYIDTHKELAIQEMKRTGVPASVKLAQGIHETAAGTSPLVIKSNNHFGIKCKTGWSGPSVKHDDDARNECFRKYESVGDSYRDHSNFLKGSARYASLFKLDPADYEGWAWGLKKAGYATNPKYAQTIIKLIEDYGLQEYTLIALGKKSMELEETVEPAPENVIAEDSNKGEDAAVDSPVKLAQAQAGSAPAIQQETAKADVVAPLISPAKKSNKEDRYPSGVFKQNGRKAIFVRTGTPFLAIAQQCDLPLAKIFEYNEMAPVLESPIDQLVYLEKKARNNGKLLSFDKK